MKAIIITTDLSNPAANAALYGAAFANRIGVQKILLYYSIVHTYKAGNTPLSMEIQAMEKEVGLLALSKLKDQIQEIVNDQVSIVPIVNGLPLLEGIEELIHDFKAQLVVVGSTGRGGLERFMLGSNTIQLANSCTAPLLIVPEEARFSMVESIVFASDLDDVDTHTPVALLSLLTLKLPAKLLVLNVSLKGKRVSIDSIPEQYKIYDLLEAISPSYHYPKGSSVAGEIMDFAKANDAGLIITVPRGKGFFEGLFRQSTTKQLAQQTHIPLLVVKS